ncbi:Phosphate transport ATP-binding protein PstB (TC 3.A.1.7.1) [Corynebacterium xerosis]|nr:Phosphate transport ATP-binding protein PstB (TC 3.A.1.7.1) [Corynebacterium xerosis]
MRTMLGCMNTAPFPASAPFPAPTDTPVGPYQPAPAATPANAVPAAQLPHTAGHAPVQHQGHPGFSAGHHAPVLSARHLTMTYGTTGTATHALAGVDLDIARADSLAVMGPSGCGKTTLLHILAGILRPTSGTVQHDGTDLAALGDRARTRLRRSDFGFVFQDGQLLPELTAIENVILPRMLAGVSRRTATAEAGGWLDRLGLQGMHERRPTQLSGGQAQRVAIARALAGRPSVVFADEPTGALDQATGQAVLDILVQSCRDSGASLVMVTHDAKVAAVCRRTVAMRDGRIAQEFVRPDATAQGVPAQTSAAASVEPSASASVRQSAQAAAQRLQQGEVTR